MVDLIVLGIPTRYSNHGSKCERKLQNQNEKLFGMKSNDKALQTSGAFGLWPPVTGSWIGRHSDVFKQPKPVFSYLNKSVIKSLAQEFRENE